MSEIAADDPPTVEALNDSCRNDALWVHVTAADLPCAYLMLDVLDGHAHVEQVSVHPDYAGRKLGQSLLLLAERWGTVRGCKLVTLTTFAEIPWNAPYYKRCGYEVMSDADIGPQLLAIRAHEASVGLDRWPRVCMSKPIA